MRPRLVAASLIASLLAAPAFADTNSVHSATPVPSSKSRSPVEMRSGSPIKRAPKVVTHRHGSAHFWVQPTVFLPIVIWQVVVVPMPASAAMTWQQEQPVDPVDGWSEMVYQVPPGGSQLLLSFDQPVQFDFAEIVYQDGSAQTVDLSGPTRNPGTYNLAQLDPTRVVDHVRVVAQATDSVAYLQLIGE